MKLNGNDSRKAPAPKKKPKSHRALNALLAVVLLVAAAVAGYAIWERPPAIAAPQPAQPTPEQAATQPVESAAPADGPDVSDPDDDPDNSAALTTDATHRDGVYTVLLVGRDAASNSTDTIIVGRFDTVAHTVDCVSIPRDTLINISWSSTPKKINAVYPGYINSGKDGVEALRNHVAKLLGFEVDCYVVVSMDAVAEVVDAIGGVWYDVPEDMYYWDFAQNLSITIPAGYQLLNGEDTVKVCRFRDSYAGGDIERIGVQQDVLKTLASQVLTVGNIPNLSTLAEIVAEHTETDLTAANIAWFARQFLRCSMDDVKFHTLPIATGSYIGGVSVVSIDVPAWLDMVNTCLTPFDTPLTEQNVDILCANASGTSVWATTGVVAGGEDSFFCMTCTVKNGGVSAHHLPGLCPED
ncbi:MAG: LytR family transcriptional regulator [Ruminococcaceae bacterium]|nr:LytR family transcriptional regulator [Oscillospiraceae bacterium]